MKHVKKLTKDTPVKASILNWGPDYFAGKARLGFDNPAILLTPEKWF